MNLNDLNHASLTSCDQDASSKLLCRYRLIRAARNCHQSHRALTAHRPVPFCLAGGLSGAARASERMPTRGHDLKGAHRRNPPARTHALWAGDLPWPTEGSARPPGALLPRWRAARRQWRSLSIARREDSGNERCTGLPHGGPTWFQKVRQSCQMSASFATLKPR